MHRCYGAEVGQLILSSGMVNRTLSQICGRLYFPTFLFSVGVVYSDVDGLLDGSGNAMTLSSNYSKVLH